MLATMHFMKRIIIDTSNGITVLRKQANELSATGAPSFRGALVFSQRHYNLSVFVDRNSIMEVLLGAGFGCRCI